MKENTYCPWCGRNMDKLENGKLDGHTWYRDDSDYIKNIERSRDFMKEQLESIVRCKDCKWNKAALCGDGTSDCAFFGVNLTPDDIERGFCAWGERVEEGEYAKEYGFRERMEALELLELMENNNDKEE